MLDMLRDRIKLSKTMFAILLAFSVLCLFTVPQTFKGSTIQGPLGEASAQNVNLSDGINNSMQSYVPIMLVIIFVVVVVGFVLTLRKGD